MYERYFIAFAGGWFRSLKFSNLIHPNFISYSRFIYSFPSKLLWKKSHKDLPYFLRVHTFKTIKWLVPLCFTKTIRTKLIKSGQSINSTRPNQKYTFAFTNKKTKYKKVASLSLPQQTIHHEPYYHEYKTINHNKNFPDEKSRNARQADEWWGGGILKNVA